MHDETQKLPAILLTPRGPYRVGDIILATWAMTNGSEHDLAGARLSFRLPVSVEPILAHSSIAGTRGEAVASAFGREGFGIASLRRGESITAEVSLRVVRESVAAQTLSLSLDVDDVTSYATDAVEIGLRARALLVLAQPPHAYGLDAAERRMCIAFTLRNVGEMRAERVDLAVPPPPGFALSRVRLSNGSAAAVGKEPFRLPDLPRDEELDVVLEFESRGGDALGHVEVGGIRIAYAGGTLYPDPIVVEPERTDTGMHAGLAASASTVEPGEIVRLELTIVNPARADAPGVMAAFTLPPELAFCSGTIAVNGGCDARRNDPRAIAVGTVLGRSQTTVALFATAISPLVHGETFVVEAAVDGRDVAPLTFTIKSEPAFPSAANGLEMDAPALVGAGEIRTIRIRAANVGTADAQRVRVRVVSPQLIVERAAIVLSSGARENVTVKPTVSREGVPCVMADLGVVHARDLKTLEVDVRAPDHFADGDAFALRADLRYDGGKDFDIGSLSLVGRCRPSIDVAESGLSGTRADALRAGQIRSYTLRVKNAGLAAARGVTVSLNLPGMLAVEAINGESARGDVIAIREIPAGAAVEIPIALRLVESVDGGGEVTIAPVVSGDSISSVALQAIRIATQAQSFLDEFSTKIEKRDRDLVATMQFRNVGDATAHHVVVAAIDMPNAYLLGSTRVNENPVADVNGASPLARGVMLPPLAPGRDVLVSYRMTESDADGARVAFAVSSRVQEEILCDPVTYRSPHAIQKRVEADFVAPVPARAQVPHFVNDPAPLEPFRSPFAPAPLSNGNGSNRNGSNGHGKGSGNGNGYGTGFQVMPIEIASSVPNATAVAAPLTRGLVGVIVMDRAEIERVTTIARTVLDVAALGTYRHFFAMRALVPQTLLGASGAVSAQWAAVHDRARADLHLPLAAASRPGFAADAMWADQFQDAASGATAATAIAAIRQAETENVTYEDVPPTVDQIRGTIGRDFESYLSSLSETNGNVLNLIFAEAIPTESSRDPQLSKALKRYRERLKLLFAALLYQSPTARHERMLSGLDVELDESLHTIVDRLHDRRWF